MKRFLCWITRHHVWTKKGFQGAPVSNVSQVWSPERLVTSQACWRCGFILRVLRDVPNPYKASEAPFQEIPFRRIDVDPEDVLNPTEEEA